MKTPLVLLLVFFAAVCNGANLLFPGNGTNLISGQYIVVFKEHVTDLKFYLHVASLKASLQKSNGDQFIDTYHIGTFRAYAAKFSKEMLQQELNGDDIDYVEADQRMFVSQSCSQYSNAVWGLNRISEQELFLDGNYRYPSTSGSGVDAYIIDTGVYTSNTEFQGRAVFGVNYAGDGQNVDCNGHGTHVAGTIGGANYGVAKKVSLIGVKVLGCDGSGSNAGVISGVNWVAQRRKSTGRPSLANMSLGGGKSTALDQAVTQAIAGGTTFAVAAGNENSDACLGSPSGVPTAITVGATALDDAAGLQVDVRSDFSNWGKCVDILAPGSAIKSSWIGSANAVLTISGTSMACPHVAGAVAVYLGNNPTSTPAQVSSYLIGQATTNVIDLDCTMNGCSNTVNRLLYSSC